MLFYGEKIKQDVMLWAKAKRFSYLVHMCSYIQPVHQGGATGGHDEAGENGHDCCLAGAVVAKKDSRLSMVQVETHAV